MKSKKHIDDLFKEGISGFTVEPTEEVWESIEGAYFGGMAAGRKWILFGSAAVLLLLAGLTGWFFLADDVSSEEYAGQKQPENILPIIEEGSESNEKVPVTLESGAYDRRYYDSIGESVTSKPGPDDPASRYYTGTKTHEEVYGWSSDIDEVSNIDEVESFDQTQTFTNTQLPRYTDIAWVNSLGISFESNPDTEMIDPDKIPGMKAYLEKQKKSHFYTGLSATPAMMYYPSTKDQFAWSADVTFGITLNRFYIETGIGYQEMKEEGIYSIELKSKDSIGFYNEVQSFEINPANPNEIIYNTAKVTVYDSISHFEHTKPSFKYSYVNIPINFGYKFFDKKKFSASVETGITFSFMTGKEIPEPTISDPEYTVVQMINETPERVNMNFRWQLGVRLDYKITGAMSVAVKPIFTKYLNSIYDIEKGYPDVKPYSIGLQVGLYYGF